DPGQQESPRRALPGVARGRGVDARASPTGAPPPTRLARVGTMPAGYRGRGKRKPKRRCSPHSNRLPGPTRLVRVGTMPGGYSGRRAPPGPHPAGPGGHHAWQLQGANAPRPPAVRNRPRVPRARFRAGGWSAGRSQPRMWLCPGVLPVRAAGPQRKAMEQTLDPGRLPSDGWRHTNKLAALLEAAWRQAETVDLAGFLPPPGDALRPAALHELIKTDLEIRWRRGKPADLEHYLRAFPELGPADALPAPLLYEEY